MSDHCSRPFVCDGNCTCEPFRVYEINSAMSAEQRRSDRMILIAVGIVAFTISLIGLAAAANYGLERVERQYQQDARV